MSAHLLTVEDLAAATGEHVQTWRQRIRRRELPARRVGSPTRGKVLVHPDDFTAWLDALPTVGTPTTRDP